MPRMLWLVLLLCACGDERLFIESDTSWSGTVDGVGLVSGHGDEEFDLAAEGDQAPCWTLNKTTDAGTLRAYAEADTWFGLGVGVHGEATTREARGQVRGCVR